MTCPSNLCSIPWTGFSNEPDGRAQPCCLYKGYIDNMYVQTNTPDEILHSKFMKDLRELFPEREIPDPVLFDYYAWPDGVTYWLPGNYDPAKVSREALHPFETIYVCGESFSMRQGWMEGALEHAAELLKLINK